MKDQTAARLQQAFEHVTAGRLEQAHGVLLRALQASPRDPRVLMALATVLLRQGKADAAVYHAERAHAADPVNVDALRLVIATLIECGRVADAGAALDRACARQPALGALWVEAAVGQWQARRYPAVEVICREGLRRAPEHPAMSAMLGAALMMCGRTREASAALRRAAEVAPDDLDVASDFAVAMNHNVEASPAEVFAAHRAFGERIERLRPDRGPAESWRGVIDTDPDRVLRVGVVTYEYRRSSVAAFMEAMLAGLDRERFTLVCYHTGQENDSTTERLRSYAAEWRHLPWPTDDDLARRIREDRIDIAIDLTGHTGRRALGAFQPRCAPVQVSYIGYSNTTGMRAFDHRIVDSITDPPGAADALATERLVRLDPCFLCYTPPGDAPAVAPLPRERAGFITFGTMNDVVKINERVLAVWARVLGGVAGSRLLIKSRRLDDAAIRDGLLARAASAGIDPVRIEIVPYTASFREHLEVYSRIDLALDTFPYNGTTTTCEALYMGVPVIGLTPGPEHDRHAARVGMSLLRAAGVPELVAADEDGYVRLAGELASDPDRLGAMRAGLRERVERSVLCDAAAFGQRLGAALRTIWRERCAGGA